MGVKVMKYAAIACIMLLGIPTAALAETKSGPGQSEFAPGQQTGPAKKSAPGQKMQKKDLPAPGASEYAPGQQGKKTPKKTQSNR
jgi:hypothetical protein